jgi:hypothetical protein
VSFISLRHTGSSLQCALAIENRRRHDCAVLGETKIDTFDIVLVCLLRSRFVILKETTPLCLAERQIRSKPMLVSTNRLIKCARLNAVNQGRITIKHYGVRREPYRSWARKPPESSDLNILSSAAIISLRKRRQE